MPLWAIIMGLGALGSGGLFLAARSMRGTARDVLKPNRKKLKEAAVLAAKGAGKSPVQPIEVIKAEQPVVMSQSLPSHVAKVLEELQQQRMPG